MPFNTVPDPLVCTVKTQIWPHWSQSAELSCASPWECRSHVVGTLSLQLFSPRSASDLHRPLQFSLLWALLGLWLFSDAVVDILLFHNPPEPGSVYLIQLDIVSEHKTDRYIPQHQCSGKGYNIWNGVCTILKEEARDLHMWRRIHFS